jgi:hypothetical protein
LNVIELDVVPPCPECGRPMARVAGPDKHRGWTCVNCNAAGDPEEDHLEDPADSRPCGCEEAEALKAERDTFRDLARARGDLLVSEVERRLAAERQLTIIRGIDTESAESRLAEATALLRGQLEKTGMPDADGEGPSRETVETWGAFVQFVADLVYDADSVLNRGLSATPAQAAEPEPAHDTPADRAIADCRAALDSMLHPDTIALRECRAELDRYKSGRSELTRWAPSVVDADDEDGPVYQGFLTDPDGIWVRFEDADLKIRACAESRRCIIESLESARAERDTALQKRHEAIQEQARLAGGCNAALARIAELQSGFDAAVRAAAQRDTRIARAVAELEQCRKPRTGAVERALEALR